MSVDTKCFVITDDWKKACQTTEKALSAYVRGELDKEADKVDATRLEYLSVFDGAKKFTNGCRVFCNNSFDSFYLNFKVYTENRAVFLFVEESSHNLKDYTDKPVVRFSVGKWGGSDKIMEVLTEALKDLGDVWYLEDDSVSDEYVKV